MDTSKRELLEGAGLSEKLIKDFEERDRARGACQVPDWSEVEGIVQEKIDERIKNQNKGKSAVLHK